MTPFDLLWIFFVLASLQPMVQQRWLTYQRAQTLRAIEKRDRSCAITLIHRRGGLPDSLGSLSVDSSTSTIPKRSSERSR